MQIQQQKSKSKFIIKLKRNLKLNNMQELEWKSSWSVAALDVYLLVSARCSCISRSCVVLLFSCRLSPINTLCQSEGEGDTLDVEPLREETSYAEAVRYGTLCQRISPFCFHVHFHVHQRMEWIVPSFDFPAEAGSHLLTQEGWNAELA